MADEPTAAPSFPWDGELWKAAISAAREDAKSAVTKGREHVEAYLGRDTLKRRRGRKYANPPNDFTFTSQKVALLFFKFPDVHVKAEEESARMRAPLLGAVLNQRILPKAHVQTLMDQMLTDLVLATGFGACKISYEGHDEPLPPEPVMEPETDLLGQPVLDELGAPKMRQALDELGEPRMETPIDPATGKPQMRTISENIRAERIPPGRFLFPAEFLGGNFHDAAWVGYDFYETAQPGEKNTSNTLDNEQLLVPESRRPKREQSKLPKKRITQVWYKAKAVDPKAHPDQIRYFEICEGETEPRKHEPSPNQFLRPDGTMGGWNKYPILVLTTRCLPDAPIPPSDTEITRQTFDEIAEGRTQLLTARDRHLPQVAYNGLAVTPETKKNLEKNIESSWVAFNGPIQPDTMQPINKGHINTENFEFNAQAERDARSAWSMPESTLGLTSQGGAKTATEVKSVEVNSATRMDYERARVIAFICDELVAGLASLTQQFAARFDDIELNGPALDPQTGQPIATGETKYLQWDRARIQGNFTYTIQAGAALRHDAIAEQQKAKDFYVTTRQDTGMNAGEVSRIYAEACGYNWEKLRQAPPVPTPTPSEVIALIKKPEIDLNPMSPHYPNVLILLKWGGAPTDQMLAAITPVIGQEALGLPPQPGDPMHAGTQPGADLVDKHVADLTGELPGGGSLVETSSRVQ